MAESKKREIFIDNIKIFACILVVLGHFFQSMIKANILPKNNLYLYFNQIIYYFHVPLFFVCSGYLYQKYSKVITFSNWKNNVLKKLLVLGVPYLTFSIITWVLKSVFSSSVNKMAGGILYSLFIYPISPYWYLYCLLFIFVITPTFSSKKIALYAIFIALAFKIINLTLGGDIYVIKIVFTNEIWFVSGMCLVVANFEKLITNKSCLNIGVILGVLFMVFSLFVYFKDIKFVGIDFLLGIIACEAVILISGYFFKDNFQNKYIGFLSEYTMPIFLMHTIFAASVRSFLIKIGIISASIHVILGITISFIGPIIATILMYRFKWMLFILYPGRYFKFKK